MPDQGMGFHATPGDAGSGDDSLQWLLQVWVERDDGPVDASGRLIFAST